MNLSLTAIALLLAGSIGSPLVQGIKKTAQLAGRPIAGKPAVWLTLGTSGILAIAALAIGGAFSAPYPEDPAGWIARIGGGIGAVFTMMTLIYKQLDQAPPAA